MVGTGCAAGRDGSGMVLVPGRQRDLRGAFVVIAQHEYKQSEKTRYFSLGLFNSDVYTDQLAPYGNMATMVNWGHPVSFS